MCFNDFEMIGLSIIKLLHECKCDDCRTTLKQSFSTDMDGAWCIRSSFLKKHCFSNPGFINENRYDNHLVVRNFSLHNCLVFYGLSWFSSNRLTNVQQEVDSASLISLSQLSLLCKVVFYLASHSLSDRKTGFVKLKSISFSIFSNQEPNIITLIVM